MEEIPSGGMRAVSAMEKMRRSLAEFPRRHPWLFGVGVFYLLSILFNIWFFSCGESPPLLVRVDR